MLITYVLCLIAGGVLIALALDSDGDLSGDGSGGNLTILFNTPFWSFGLFGFGFSGLLLTWLAPAGSWLPSGVVAVVMGVAMGWVAAYLLRLMARREADSLVRSEDLIGLEGLVTLDLTQHERGFVELQARGSLIRRPAVSVQGSITKGASVVVVDSDGHTLSVEPM